MSRFKPHVTFLLIAAALLGGAVWLGSTNQTLAARGEGDAEQAFQDEQSADFDRDVLPFLSNNCFKCHGPMRQEAGLRLDLEVEPYQQRESGKTPIVAGKSGQSEIIRRLKSTDPDVMMPPPSAREKKSIDARQVEKLARWIDDGAEWEKHWAFVPPIKAPMPKVKNAAWPGSAVDHFILARLEANGLTPSDEASRETLTRRLYLDLLGLPPTLEQLDAALADRSDQWYENLVDHLLASPHFGERMAQNWLDASRFGDTNGFHFDSTREMWLWRDWVISAFNSNMPYDQFVIEQMAGDLLANPTTDQLIASGYNRNTTFNEEGGADPEEFIIRYAIDRVGTIATQFMGLTLACAECHNHPYDPFSQKEFYEMMAFVNNIEEPMRQGYHNQPLHPLLTVPMPKQEQTITELEKQKQDVEQQIAAELAKVDYKDPLANAQVKKELTEPVDYAWIDDDVPSGAKRNGDGQNPVWHWVGKEDHPVQSGLRSTRRSAGGLNQHYFDGAMPLLLHEGDVLFAHVWMDPKNPPKMLQLQFYDGNWNHRVYWGENRGHGSNLTGPANHPMGDLPETGQWVRLEVDLKTVGLAPGSALNGWAFTQFDGTAYWDNAGVRTLHPPSDEHLHSLSAWEKVGKNDQNVPANVKEAIAVANESRTADQSKTIKDYFVRHIFAEIRQTFDPLNQQLTELDQQITNTRNAMPTTMVARELMNDRRETFVLMRGNFLTPGEKVTAGTPEILPPLPDGEPAHRLSLAKWLVQRDHPLTARVFVNRLWQHFFGTGIVKTTEDFGAQGERPTHPLLLDYLSADFTDNGWDVKHLVKQIVMSKAYRQESTYREDAAEVDPYNRLLHRGARLRVAAEQVRDIALANSGLLNRDIGGPPVFPYQPGDYYTGKNNGWRWMLSSGDDLYRRGMYTFWRRTTLYPSFVIFDAPSREYCQVSRARTNTPLQALTTLNDPAFVEAARVFAQNLLKDGPANPNERLTVAFRTATSRYPNEAESTTLRALLKEQLHLYRADLDAASQLVANGQYPQAEGLDPAEHAAWTAVCNVLLNLDETITKE